MSRFNRGPGNFLKPENALKRAEELISVGQKNSALQTLHDVITSKRYRTWQKVLEQIMFKYVDLCIELKKGRYAKDGLIHYRNVCQQVNVQSLEEVIKYFMKTATDKAEEAQSKATVRLCLLNRVSRRLCVQSARPMHKISASFLPSFLCAYTCTGSSAQFVSRLSLLMWRIWKLTQLLRI